MENQALFARRHAGYSIGQLAQLSGLPIKTIRFYSDVGLLPPAGRTDSGHRRYNATDLARLQLVRSLRDLDVDVPTIRRVLEGHDALGDILSAHIQTLETRIRALRHQLAVLRAASRSPSEATVRRVQALARLQAADRRRLLERFWDRVFEGVPIEPTLAERFRGSGTPELPDDASPQQLDAWLELAQLASDDDFVRRIRESSTWFWRHVERESFDAAAWHADSSALAERAAVLQESGVLPDDQRADPLVDELAGSYAAALGRQDSSDFRAWLHDQLQANYDPRAARYWELTAAVTGQAPDPRFRRVGMAFMWLFEALGLRVARARAQASDSDSRTADGRVASPTSQG